ncbi:MAG: ribbon-helix-helix protein, CopG family [Deltaproteobacteria bacterium]|nr:ribbon-helix-helix protein, CopG family [Deltaproteobacteria bacterium]
MAQSHTQVLGVRLPRTFIKAVQQAADDRGIGVSELVRSALLAYLQFDPQTRRFATMVYEVAKTRHVLLRLLDTQLTKPQVDALLRMAEDDATHYVRERLEKSKETA